MKCLDGISLLVLKVMLLKTVVYWRVFLFFSFFLNLDFACLWILKMQFVDTTAYKQGLTFVIR